MIEPEKTQLIKEIKHDRPLTSCYWDPLGRFIFFGAEDNFVHRYDLATQALVRLSRHDSWIRAMGSTPNGETLFTGGYDGRLVSWPAADSAPQPIHAIDAHQGWIRALATSPDGQRLATCGNDHKVKLWDAVDCKLVQEFTGHSSHVYNLVFSQDSQNLYSCDLKGLVKQWPLVELESGGPPPTARDVVVAEKLAKYDTTFRADIGGARSIALKPDGSQLALGGITNVTNAFAGVGEVAVVVVDLAQSKVALQLEAKEKIRGAAWGLVYHPTGFWIGLSAGGGGGWLYFWKGDTTHEFFKFKLKNDGRGLSMSPDATQLAVAHFDQHLRIYGITT